MPRFVKSYMQPKTPSDHAIVERSVARARTPEGAALAASMWRSFATREHDLREQADKLTAPTQILWGKKDKASPPSGAPAPPTSSCRTQSWRSWTLGTLSSRPAPEAFLRVVEPFLASLPVDPSVERR